MPVNKSTSSFIFVAMDINTLYQHYLKFPSVQTDTRKLKPGDIFFALKGPSFNGNHYAKQALDSGASLCVVDEAPDFEDERIMLTPDALQTLQQLALMHRKQFSIPFIAITGSNGKTTTKELIHAVLSTTYKTYTTEGNLNNHIGIPLTILKIRKDAEIAVIEMGANHQKEIEGYCTYALPTHGLITNCGKAHLEGFGGVEGVRKGKGELFDHLRAHDGTAFIFSDYDYLHDMSRGIARIIKYGTHGADLDIEGKIASDSGLLEVSITGGISPVNIHTQLVGGYNLPNVLAAVCIGKTFDVPVPGIKAALETYSPSNSRSQLMEVNGNKIILDAYNANPSSMKAAIENFAAMPGGNKVLMLGAMMEMGDQSDEEHAALVDLISRNNWKAVVLVGSQFKKVAGKYHYFDNVSAATAWFREQKFEDALILIKGSRSMQMEKVLD